MAAAAVLVRLTQRDVILGRVGSKGTPTATLDAGFFNPLKRRETCCFGEDLTKTGERLDSWIDHVVTRPRVKTVSSSLVGAGQVGGLYPSDHAGIAATLRLP